jgi:hypothetical protein
MSIRLLSMSAGLRANASEMRSPAPYSVISNAWYLGSRAATSNSRRSSSADSTVGSRTGRLAQGSFGNHSSRPSVTR